MAARAHTPRGERLRVDRTVAMALLDDTRTPQVERWTTAARRRLEHDGAILFAISDLRLPPQAAQELAVSIAGALTTALVAGGLPSAARVEVDAPQTTDVPAGHRTRTLLPHHDGGHCSYLTPSLADVPDWNPAERTFSKDGYCTTPAHKLYQGIFVLEPGDGSSITTYYPWIRLIARAFRRRHERSGSVPELAAWLAEGLRAALGERAANGARYPSIAACLGARSEPAFAVIAHCAEAELDPTHVQRYPELEWMGRSCPCGRCPGPSGRVFCRLLGEAAGLTWSELREEFELALTSRALDFVLGHNLTLLHGGIEGGRSRTLQPVSIVIDNPAGPDYETWLAGEWRRRQGSPDLRRRRAAEGRS
jgi:hypothetical protein